MRQLLLGLVLGCAGEPVPPGVAPAAETPIPAAEMPGPAVPPPADRTPGLPGTAERQVPAPGVQPSGGQTVASPQAAGIRAVVRAGSSDVKRCYEQALTRQPGLAGRMAFDVTVSAGTVTQVDVALDEPGDEALVACIRGVIEAWRFDAEVRDTLHIPFVFNAS